MNTPAPTPIALALEILREDMRALVDCHAHPDTGAIPPDEPEARAAFDRYCEAINGLEALSAALPSPAPTPAALAARLLEHAAVHDAEASPYSPEQAHWAADLRAAAALLQSPHAGDESHHAGDESPRAEPLLQDVDRALSKALAATPEAYRRPKAAPSAVPEGYALVPVEPTPEMIEAARDVKRQRLVRAAAELKQGRRPDTIGMALAVNEEWAAMLAAAPVPAAPVVAAPERPTREDLIAALKFYADGEHFQVADCSAWDTVSGEPPNWLCDEAGTATVEDGHIAKATLAGQLTAEQIEADE